MFSGIICRCATVISCEHKTKTRVDVKVLKEGVAQQGVLVYMFDTDPNMTFHDNKMHAKDYAATDKSGLAEFVLDDMTFMLDDKVTYMFVTFDSADKINGSLAVTIKKGETKSVEINQY